jgi:hypothetical protein
MGGKLYRPIATYTIALLPSVRVLAACSVMYELVQSFAKACGAKTGHLEPPVRRGPKIVGSHWEGFVRRSYVESKEDWEGCHELATSTSNQTFPERVAGWVWVDVHDDRCMARYSS